MKRVAKYLTTVSIVFLIYLILLYLSFIISDSIQITDISDTQIMLPHESELESIVLSESKDKSNNKIVISNNEEIRDIIEGIKYNSKKTNGESVGESPINVDNYINLEFIYSTEGTDLAYIYKIKNKYYIEQPYSSIFRITQEIYDDINNMK